MKSRPMLYVPKTEEAYPLHIQQDLALRERWI